MLSFFAGCAHIPEYPHKLASHSHAPATEGLLVARLTNIQLRRFNPGRVRKGAISRMFQMGTQFKVLNRRMHNKQMVVDGRWGMIGGRNLGNPYCQRVSCFFWRLLPIERQL